MELKRFLEKLEEGQLTTKGVGMGMHLSYINACSLTSDAQKLLITSPARSISLAVLAIEEIGKIILMCKAAPLVAKGPVPFKEIEKKLKLRDHKHKQEIFGNYGKNFIQDLITKVEGKDPYSEEFASELAPLFDRFKQFGFYVNFVDGEFQAPRAFGANNVDLAKSLIKASKQRLKTFKPLHNKAENSIKMAKLASNLQDGESIKKIASRIKNVIKDFGRAA